jgi:DNA polymerase III delta subunit
MPPAAPLGYYWGDDSYGVNHGPDALAVRLAGDGPPLDRLRMNGIATTAAEIGEKVATATLFGGGTLVVVADPGPLVATKPLAVRLNEALSAVAPGNGLAFLDAVDGTARRPASLEALRKSVADAGGDVREFPAPTRDQMARWIGERARERDIRISPAAAALLAERVGANVRERDVDRRRQGELAVSELEKLAVYRLDGQIVPEDVQALVADAVPGSTWAFLDAVGTRSAREAAGLLDRLLETTPEPVLVAVLHRRIRELLLVADHRERGETIQATARALKLKEFPARKLWEQGHAWREDELIGALEGLLELDAALKGERGSDARRRRLAFSLWLAERVART